MPRVTAASKDGELKLAMIEKGRELLGLSRHRIPEGGHVSMAAWPDGHISVDICRPDGGSELHAWTEGSPYGQGGPSEVWE